MRERKSVWHLLPPRASSKLEKFKKSVLLLGWGVVLAQIMALPFYCGAVLGYLSAKYFAGRSTAQPGKVRSLVFNIGSYRVHLHHWTLSGLLIASLHLKGLQFLELLLGVSGFCAALIFHGIYSYTDWYKIISRK